MLNVSSTMPSTVVVSDRIRSERTCASAEACPSTTELTLDGVIQDTYHVDISFLVFFRLLFCVPLRRRLLLFGTGLECIQADEVKSHSYKAQASTNLG